MKINLLYLILKLQTQNPDQRWPGLFLYIFEQHSNELPMRLTTAYIKYKWLQSHLVKGFGIHKRPIIIGKYQ